MTGIKIEQPIKRHHTGGTVNWSLSDEKPAAKSYLNANAAAATTTFSPFFDTWLCFGGGGVNPL